MMKRRARGTSTWPESWLAIGLVVFLLTVVAGNGSYTLGATPDPTPEAAHAYGAIPLDPATYQEYLRWEDARTVNSLPAAYDARNDGIVTSVKNQGTCGSCWAFASVGAMESHLAKFHAAPLIDLSEQQLVSCDTSQLGCGGGYATAILFWGSQGPIYEGCFGYTETDTTPCSGAAQCGELDFRVEAWHTVPTSIDQIKLSVYNRGPTWFSFDVYSDFESYWLLDNGVYVNSAGSTWRGGHAVLIIGWDDSKGAWLLKNSWGESWWPLAHTDGTFWMAYEGHAQPLNFQMVNFDVAAVDHPWGFTGQRWATRQGGWLNDMQWFVGDFDGDGREDLAGAFPDGGQISIDVRPSTGTAFEFQRWATGQGAWLSNMRWFVGDFDGDGRDDLAGAFPDGGQISIDVHASTGTAFAFQRWTTRQGGWLNDMQWFVGDFSGDGRDDLAGAFSDAGNTSIDARPSTGTAFQFQRWATQRGGWLSSMKWFVGDFTGDGRDDLAGAFSDAGNISIDVRPSTGTAFAFQRWATQQGGWLDDMKWFVGDFDGDGRADLAGAFPDGGQISIDVHASTGTALELERWATRQGGWLDDMKWFGGDYNGDGQEDLSGAFSEGGKISMDVHASTGTGFERQRWATWQGDWLDGMQWFVGDFSGDSRDDLAGAFSDGGNISIDVRVARGPWFLYLPMVVR